MDITIKDTERVSPFFAFFLIHSVQIGVGILGFQRVIVKNAGYDAWMSIILAGIANQVILWLMYELLKRGNGDLISIHRKIFGKWIGGFLSTLFILYVLLAATVFLRSFTQVVQVWVFPQLSTWIFCAVLLLLACYYIVGGFRTVAGLCFLSVI
jgi:Spore germination protein